MIVSTGFLRTDVMISIMTVVMTVLFSDLNPKP